MKDWALNIVYLQPLRNQIQRRADVPDTYC